MILSRILGAIKIDFDRIYRNGCSCSCLIMGNKKLMSFWKLILINRSTLSIEARGSWEWVALLATRSVQELNWPTSADEERDAMQQSEPLRPLQQLERGEQGAKAHSKAERLPVKVEGPNSLSRHPASTCRTSSLLVRRGPYTPLRYNERATYIENCSYVSEKKFVIANYYFCRLFFFLSELVESQLIYCRLWHRGCVNCEKLQWFACVLSCVSKYHDIDKWMLQVIQCAFSLLWFKKNV